MRIYDENGQEIQAPDLSLGWLENCTRITGTSAPIEAVTHLEEMPGTDGLRRVVVDAPAVPARPIYESYQVYHPLPVRQKTAIEIRMEELEARMEDTELLLADRIGGAV